MADSSPYTAYLTSLGAFTRLCKKLTLQAQPVHSIYAHSRVCGILAAIVCYGLIACFVHFLGSTAGRLSASSSWPRPATSSDGSFPLASDLFMQDPSFSAPHPQASRSGVFPQVSYKSHPSDDRSCDGKRVYIHSLPAAFNRDIVSECGSNSRKWIDVCSAAANGGLGPVLGDAEDVLVQPDDGRKSWYETEQFILDVLFHSRMKKYQCLTSNSSEANLIYVPFYAGLDSTRYLWDANLSVRDYLSKSLADWLIKQPEWNVKQGIDHFIVTGKNSWDFRRTVEDESGWGNNLLELPVLKVVSVLLIEKGPNSASHVEHAIPYPTFYHPHTDAEMLKWQNSMRAKKRVNLFAFAGADQPDNGHTIGVELMQQCRSSKSCKLLECSEDGSGCNSAIALLKLFQESVFCLQPAGNSYTRRSVFNSMVCGCIPVLFHAHTVYTQYDWHLPHNFSSYSVFIPEQYIRAKMPIIEGYLRRFSATQVAEMREKVIRLIPSLIYGHPDNQFEKVKDAFDLSIEALLRKVRTAKKDTKL